MLKLNATSCCPDKKNALGKLRTKLIELPFWVKQYLYIELREDLGKFTDIQKLDIKTKDDLIQSYVPTPTPTGQRYRQRRFNQFAVKMDIPKDEIQLLRSLDMNKTIIDICNENQWSLIKCSKVLVTCIEKGLIEHINNNNIATNVYYLAGKIRLGEYLLRTNKLSLEQVDKALYTQKEISQQVGENTRIGDLLVNLGYIKESDKNDILSLKENSDSVCALADEAEEMKEKIAELERKLETLRFENDGYKQDLEDYNLELYNKSQAIVNLEQEINDYKSKKFNLKKLFTNKLTLKRT